MTSPSSTRPPGPTATEARDEEAWSVAFLSRLVHELRTPLASLRIASDVLLEEPAMPAALGPVVAGLAAALADVDEILEPMSELNRARAGRTTPAHESIDVAALLAAVASSTASVVREAGASVEIGPGDALPPSLSSDSKLLERLLAALVRSALSGGARRIDVTARATADGAVLEVRDDGTPPPVTDQARFFELLAPLERGRRARGGTGLALPLAAAQARLLGGDLAVRVEAGQTVLELRLPLV